MRSLVLGAICFVAGIGSTVAAYRGYQYWRDNLSPEAVAMESVRRRMFDPESARFEYVQHNPATKATCGAVNAKNKMGGYVGFTSFILKADEALELEPPDHESETDLRKKLDALQKRIDFMRTWESLCAPVEASPAASAASR